MAQAFINDIIYYQMDMQWSVGLAWTYFANPDHIVVQCWVHATYSFPDTMNQTQPHTYHYTKFLEGSFGHPVYSTHGCN